MAGTVTQPTNACPPTVGNIQRIRVCFPHADGVALSTMSESGGSGLPCVTGTRPSVAR